MAEERAHNADHDPPECEDGKSTRCYQPNNDQDREKAAVPTSQPAVATPCRAAPQAEQDAVEIASSTPGTSAPPTELDSPASSVPTLGDDDAPKPNPHKLRISEKAADARLRRAMAPSLKDGSYKVSSEVLQKYRKGGKSKKSLMKIFETCGYDKDRPN